MPDAVQFEGQEQQKYEDHESGDNYEIGPCSPFNALPRLLNSQRDKDQTSQNQSKQLPGGACEDIREAIQNTN